MEQPAALPWRAGSAYVEGGMTSRELYQALRFELGGWFREHGFKVARRAQLGWQRPPILVWFQCDKWGWDRHAGSRFFVNIQVGGEPRPWNGLTLRLQELLNDSELESLRDLQNAVIGRLAPPPEDYLDAMRAGFARYPDGDALFDAVLAAFRPVTEPYRRGTDVALRYFDTVDVASWSKFLLGVLPGVLERAQNASGGLGG